MADYIVDTNVLLVASAAEPYSTFNDSDLPRDQQEAVLDWLVAFRDDAQAAIVWDQDFRIYEEYRHKLTDQDYGLQVVHEKMMNCRRIAIEYDEDGHAIVPEAFSSFDASDRKFLAVALSEESRARVANATDTDWLQIEELLRDRGVTVEHLIEKWLRAKHAEKEARK